MALGLLWSSILLCILTAIFTLDKMGFFKSKNHFPVEGRVSLHLLLSTRLYLTTKQTVVVTGGSQGMGKAVAQLLAKKGANVVIVARTVRKLEAALKEIQVFSENFCS